VNAIPADWLAGMRDSDGVDLLIGWLLASALPAGADGTEES
jgi:hypothetical protein